MATKNTYVNFFSGSPLNRLSWLRTHQSFVNAALTSPATKWLVFQKGQPLMITPPSASRPSLARLSTTDVNPLIGRKPWFGQGRAEGESAPEDALLLEGARLRGPPIVFLGLHEEKFGAHALPSSEFSAKQSDADIVLGNLDGAPYFTLDVSDIAQPQLDSALQNSEAGATGAKFSFAEPRGAMESLDSFEAGIYAAARSMVDWNSRNKHCPGCGSPVFSQWAGWKLTCTSRLPWADNAGRAPCPTEKGLHNFSHPRTDAVVIVAIVDQANEKVLLGKNKNWPPKFYSALAGFIEPGESFEDAVKREMWEEAGVKVWDVQYHSSQPWPYPASLMVGFFAVADSSQPLRKDLDNELEDARWYTRDEVLHILKHREGASLTETDHRRIADAQDERDHISHKSTSAGTSTADQLEVPFRIPPLSAIAGVMVSEWAYGRAGPGVVSTSGK